MAGSAATDLRHFTRICRKIICVGRNYREHVSELGNTVPDKPMLFLKPPSSLLLEGEGPIKTPEGCSDLHHEIELALVIGKDGKCIEESKAMEHIGGYALAIDMTSRNHQEDEKKRGVPWTLAKCWDTFCPISAFIPTSSIPDPQNIRLWLKVEDDMRQDGNTKDMIFHLPNLISYISKVMTLNIGDIILTGTPSGVSAVLPGQKMEAGIDDLIKINFEVEK